MVAQIAVRPNDRQRYNRATVGPSGTVRSTWRSAVLDCPSARPPCNYPANPGRCRCGQSGRVSDFRLAQSFMDIIKPRYVVRCAVMLDAKCVGVCVCVRVCVIIMYACARESSMTRFAHLPSCQETLHSPGWWGIGGGRDS